MKIYLLTVLSLIFHSSNGQETPKKELFNKEFNWTITIPENFENVSPEYLEELENKGLEAIEETYGDTPINKSTVIFAFRNKQNYFEANHQPFDVEVDGNYNEVWQEVNQILYNTFRAKIPTAKIDTTISNEIIDKLKFKKFEMKIKYQNQVMTYTMYNRLFGKKELTVNMVYSDKLKGQKMLESWRKSKFKDK